MMQPYQKAGKEIQRQGEFPKEILKTVGSLAATAGTTALGGLAASRVLPFLSQYIPQDLAIKGLSKIDPRFGKFINKALSKGTDFEEIKNFIKGKAEEGEEKQPAKQNGNIIQQESPELHSFVEQEIKNAGNPGETPPCRPADLQDETQGRPPAERHTARSAENGLIEAAALAQNDKRFSDIIKKLMKIHKTPWSNIIESIFGNGDTAQQQERQQPQQEQQPQQPVAQQQPQQQPQQSGGGQGLQAIMQALQQAGEARKRRQGP